MRVFRVALSGDFLNEEGQGAYGDCGVPLLERHAFIRHHFLLDQAPPRLLPSPPGGRGVGGEGESYWEHFYSLEVKPEHIAGVDGLIVLRPWVKRDTFAQGAGGLVVVGRSGAGYDKIDVQACTDHDVALFNAPLALNHSTASSALLFMLALAKKLPQQDRITRAGRWDLQAQVMGSELEGRTLGIIGLGHSGRELVRLVAPFSMHVLAYSPHADAEQAHYLGVRLMSLEEVLREADFVSLHCRLTQETKQLIGREQFTLMKPTAYFVNVARGELVDERALVEVLRNKKISGAALDVFAAEPPPPDDPLLALDNIILTPHWNASTTDVWKATAKAMAEGMIRAACGLVPDHVVNRDVLDRPEFQRKLAAFRVNET
ncbi:MAG: hypothetical protein L0215_06190 [Gemmataceae bacterium]|nr:hypothetical protein [Gemmataceae bacterium]